MKHSISKVLMAILMLLAFVGQVSSSSALPCKMDKEQSIMMDHSAHVMVEKMDSSNKLPIADCCAKNSGCSMSGCLLLGLPFLFQASNPSFCSESAEHHTQYETSESPNSLYRPPILS